ncbi:DUF5703 domain-containing protein [Pedobacter glucosidilyticus]|uniref:DUF5703 domain-containing protein n=1 Tax=Pedobacter glucosidilyticus TaxID=1122941 RepID=UPI00041262B2|nr:DUF5703 domain-containing protein [Pedobacter glucosidilyticus]
MKKQTLYSLIFLLALQLTAVAQDISSYHPVWFTQSKNSGESMPCGGGDIGLNVWTEGNDILFYLSKSGTFDEHNMLLKLGRVRIKLSPNPFADGTFKQELHLKEGFITIDGAKGTTVKISVDVFHPNIRVEVRSKEAIHTQLIYESWRYQDRALKGKGNNANSWKWAPQEPVIVYADSINFEQNNILFYHKNRKQTVFDATVKQQGLTAIQDSLYNPLAYLTSGGIISASNMKASGMHTGKYLDTDFKGWSLSSIKASKYQQINITLYQAQKPDINSWKNELKAAQRKAIKDQKAQENTIQWWRNYWQRSYIYTKAQENTEDWQIGRNYQLFRYMLGCNALGQWPTKFNGGLFTYDPSLTDSTQKFTPDFRNWGGGTHTAQNQRLVYWPMLKSGDFDLMLPQFNFYLNAIKNAELRTQFYWKHKGASFTEQLENFGLPNPAEYGWKRPADYDKGMEYNAWLEYEWDTVLEFCMMMLEQEKYTGKDIQKYIPFIQSCLTFFNEHYTYLAMQRGSKALDADGHLILYPGSAAETYKMAYNANSTIAALKTVLERLLALPDTYLSATQKAQWETMLKRIPPISYRVLDGKTTIAPAKLWERINNTETPQLYPVYPWGIFGLGKTGLDTAINTYKYDPDALKFRSHVGWKQDNIFAARLGLTDEAYRLTTLKLKDSGRRFPAFWGPGFDWTPDHNWGGSGMIGLQEMLMQCDGDKIMIFPAWPKTKDVSFKLHAPKQTTIEASLENGKLKHLKVTPEYRKKDIINFIEQ